MNSPAVPDMKLELIPLPVSDIDRAKTFYTEKLGFNTDHDVQSNETVRVLQLTLPGSGCSIVIASGLPGIEMPAGSLRGLHLVVENIEKSREILVARGVEIGKIIDMSDVRFAGLSDPDSNTWILEELPSKKI